VTVAFGVLAVGALAASMNFVEPASSPEAAGDGPQRVAAADLDGDGDRDLAVTNHESGTVTVLQNNGTGNFAAAGSSPEAAGEGPGSVAAADFDGDGDSDLAVVNDIPFGTGTVTVLRNNGSGNFTQPPSSPVIPRDRPVDVVAADLDGDSDRDLALANVTNGSGDASVSILRNNGSGRFTEPASSPEAVGTATFSIAAADLDGDSDRDLAVTNVGSSGLVTLLRNNGSGNFAEFPTSPEAVGANPEWVGGADLDGDSDTDLAVVNLASSNVTILRNNGSGNFFQPRSSPVPVGFFPSFGAAADFDGDSDQDLAVTNPGMGSGTTVTILRNNGSAKFAEPLSSPESVSVVPSSVAAADLDGDTDPDLALPSFAADSVAILRNR
jgi:hypothetical protein